MRWLASALVAIVLLGACSDRDQRGTVLVIGDSILAQATEELTTALERAGWQPVIDARSGSTMKGGLFFPEGWPSRIEDLVRDQRPDVAVIELGTNGCGDCATIGEGIDAVMEPLRAVEHVYWLNVKEQAPIPEHPAQLNEALDAATERWDNLEILDMHQRFLGEPQLLDPDTVHLSPEGEQAFAAFVTDALTDRI